MGDWFAAAAVVVAVFSLIWTVRQGRALDSHNSRLLKLEERREQRELGSIIRIAPNVVIMFDFKRQGTNNPIPVGAGVLSMVALAPSGDVIARYPPR